MIAETIDYRGYEVEVHYDEDSSNPMKEYDDSPALILHSKAEDHFGWTTDGDWADRLDDCLERFAWRRGKDHALALFTRWARVCHGVPVMLPVGAGEHSGTWVYLGSGASQFDAGGWDSGWVGFTFATPEQLAEWSTPPERVEESVRGSFEEFSSWVEGSVFGFVIHAPDGAEIDESSCWGFYGSDCIDERVDTQTVAQHLQLGSVVRVAGATAVVADIEDEGDALRVEYADGSVTAMLKSEPVTVVAVGYMREEFQARVDSEIASIHHDRAEMYRSLVNQAVSA